MVNRKLIVEIFVVILFSILLALVYNTFLIPHSFISGGVMGISMLLNNFVPLNSGIINLILNLPILFLGYLKLGKKFMILTIISVFVNSISMNLLPVTAFIDDVLLSSVFGGVLSGVCLGIILKFSASTGGFDILSLVVLLKKDFSLGIVSFCLNFVVIFISGFIYGWELALYTMLFIFVSSKIIDQLHTSHVKITLTIITEKGEELEEALLRDFYRGITLMNGKGSYTHSDKSILYMVITRYELSDIKYLIHSVDDKAFVNITKTLEVFGNFKRKK